MPDQQPHLQSNSPEMEDREANCFAMCLLMPAEFVRREVQAMGGIDIEDEKAMAKLAKKFGVSVPLMALRLGQIRGVTR